MSGLTRYRIRLTAILLSVFVLVVGAGYWGHEFTDFDRERILVFCTENRHFLGCTNVDSLVWVEEHINGRILSRVSIARGAVFETLGARDFAISLSQSLLRTREWQPRIQIQIVEPVQQADLLKMPGPYLINCENQNATVASRLLQSGSFEIKSPDGRVDRTIRILCMTEKAKIQANTQSVDASSE